LREPGLAESTRAQEGDHSIPIGEQLLQGLNVRGPAENWCGLGPDLGAQDTLAGGQGGGERLETVSLTVQTKEVLRGGRIRLDLGAQAEAADIAVSVISPAVK
jgi:hypothetical protein